MFISFIFNSTRNEKGETKIEERGALELAGKAMMGGREIARVPLKERGYGAGGEEKRK